MKSGIIFSIEEFSLYNGPGIRTTVFLKGCPLRCMWCHSPEGQDFSPQMICSPNGCLHCGACLQKGNELTGKSCLVKESAEVCPQRLIRQIGERYSVSDLVNRLQKNQALLFSSGGGVTFSGGEPLAQSEFLLECLQALDGKLHRAIQTSGYCHPSVFCKIKSECDYFLFDLKLFDEKLHQTFCGTKNGWILENYRSLASSGVPFVTRMPLIPSVTDTEENIENIACFMAENNVRKIELLPYHKLSGSKYAMTGRRYEPTFDETRAPEPRLAQWKKYGIEVSIL